MKFPIKVRGIEFGETEPFSEKRYGTKVCGQMVAVRPCAEEFGNKTYLGIMLGELALSQWVSFDDKAGTLKVDRTMKNPMIFIPEKNAVVFGCGSWWGKIKDESQLKQITDEDIGNVWYVKALKQLSEETEKVAL
jgi:hypothetical protein